jgi:NADH:ubiquinone reductase (non-electrogenic)
VESAGFPGQSDKEIERLLHMVKLYAPSDIIPLISRQVVVGGGPTGVELSGELHDFLEVN